jgi:hypothetical protein
MVKDTLGVSLPFLGTELGAVEQIFYFINGLAEVAGGESVSQSPLKDKAFSVLPDRKPPVELRSENGFPRQGKGHMFELQTARHSE